jgi:hypothetical protein
MRVSSIVNYVCAVLFVTDTIIVVDTIIKLLCVPFIVNYVCLLLLCVSDTLIKLLS